MTTPERLRRRQLVEGGLLIVIGILMLGQTFYFNAVDREQRRCVTENFQELSVALDARAALVDRETSQNQALWSIYAEAAGLVNSDDDPSYELGPKEQHRLQEKLVEQLLVYEDAIEEIKAERKENPLPPYPVGECTP
jgi:hypothetical protein